MRFTQWDQRVSTKDSNVITKQIALKHCARINAPHAREYLVDCINGDRFLDLCDYSLSYEDLTVGDAIHIRQVQALYQKRADLDVGIDKRAVAFRKFIEAEDLCLQTNDIFRLRAAGKFSFLPHVEASLLVAQRKIAQILGDVPSLEKLKLRFGPGATTQVIKRKASTRLKLSQVPACSEDLLPVIKDVLQEMEGWFSSDDHTGTFSTPVVIHNGRLDFVPKNYKADRSIGVEPALNTMVQAGIGTYIATRLCKHGLDIRDQTRNQRAALRGSLTGDLATLDLSSASDTIATELVFNLLPVDWALFLSNFRTRKLDLEYDGRTLVIDQQKFASMGNGFTFPLETLIFYGVAYAASREDELRDEVTVYGDDIIVPSSCFERCVELLKTLGFVPNVLKSFHTGKFRESCGTDYLSGINIRPLYLDNALSGFDLFRWHNFYVRTGEPELAIAILSFIDPALQKWGPDGYGDGHLIGDGGLSPHGRDRGYSGYVFETYTFKPAKKFDLLLPGDRVYPSYCTYVTHPLDEDIPIRDIRSLREYALSFEEGLAPHSYDKDGRLGVTTPGRCEVNLIKIYTLSPLI